MDILPYTEDHRIFRDSVKKFFAKEVLDSMICRYSYSSLFCTLRFLRINIRDRWHAKTCHIKKNREPIRTF